MLYLVGFMLCGLLHRFLSRHASLGRYYPDWQARQQTEGRPSGYLAFLLIFNSPLFDRAGYVEWHRPENTRARFVATAVSLALFVLLASPLLWLLFVALPGSGTK